MKRKLDQDGVPAAAEAPQRDSRPSFTTLGLDSRLLQGVAAAKFSEPTLVQAKTIPLALEGKDILGMATPWKCLRMAVSDIRNRPVANWLKLVQGLVQEKRPHISYQCSNRF
jgi:hypothetical protein